MPDPNPREHVEHGRPARELAAILAATPLIVFELDAKGIVACSKGQRLERLRLGAEAVGTSVFDLYADVPWIAQDCRRALTGEELFGSGQVAGTWFEIHYTPLSLERGGVSGVIGVASDVTDRHRAESALRESEARYRVLVDHAPFSMGIIELLDDDLLIVAINAVGARQLGLAPEQVEGRKISELGHPLGSLRDLFSHYREAAEEDKPVRFEHELLRPPEAARHLQVTLCRVPSQGRKRVCSIWEDATERKQRQARLLMASHLDSVATLAAGIAHEVNNPLAYVMGNMTFVAEEIARRVARIDAAASGAEVVQPEVLVAEQRDGLLEMARAMEDAQGGAERIRQVVKKLRIIAQSEEGCSGPVEIERVVELAIAMTEHEIKRRARLVRHYEAVPPAQGNEARLGQVVLHLLFNATQAIAEDKPMENEIRVGIRPHPSGKIAVEVADSGSGIRPEHLGRIFDPYFTTKPMGAGLGLGLSICHGIVTALGGEIEAESAPGRGSTFRVLLPPSAPR